MLQKIETTMHSYMAEAREEDVAKLDADADADADADSESDSDMTLSFKSEEYIKVVDELKQHEATLDPAVRKFDQELNTYVETRRDEPKTVPTRRTIPTPPSTPSGRRMAHTAWEIGMLALDIQAGRASTMTYDSESARVLTQLEKQVSDGNAYGMDTAIGKYVDLFGGGVCAVSWRRQDV
jgi:hypothetical protein